ncbi:hypothetical protein Pen01_15600 [Phytomonospora endophytica]|nr:hypothetical protein Pen01_15600 [Phytomonospora endophytica]
MAAVVLGGCAREPAEVAPPAAEALPITVESSASAAAFTGKVGGGIAFDYEPTASPAAAREAADLIVLGTVADVLAPSADESTAARAGGYDATVVLVVDVVESLDGESAESVRIMLPTGMDVDATALAPLASGLSVVAGLTSHGETEWHAAIDGLWFQGTKDAVMHGPYAETWELAEAWGGVETLDAYAAAIRAG